MIADRRLRGLARKRNRNILIVMVMLVAIQMWIIHGLRAPGLARLATVSVGLAAGIAALVLAKMLVQRKDDGTAEEQGAEERIQLLKLK